jgi:hypothetical protein
LNRHELNHAAALFLIAFGGWLNDPVIRMIQVERLKLQPCPTLFSKHFVPSVSHFGDESNKFCQLLAGDPSLCSIFDAESLLRRGHQQLQQMKLEWNSKSIVQYPQKVQSWESWACNL